MHGRLSTLADLRRRGIVGSLEIVAAIDAYLLDPATSIALAVRSVAPPTRATAFRSHGTTCNSTSAAIASSRLFVAT